MITATNFQEEQKLKLVRKALSYFPAYQGSDTNERFILRECLADNRATSWESVLAIIQRFKGQLAETIEYSTAYREFFATHPEYAGDMNVKQCHDALRDSGEAISYGALSGLLDPGHPYTLCGRLVLNAEAQRAQADEQERAQLIAEISRGKSTYSARDRFGKVQVYVSAELDGESTERLREIAGIVSEQRRLLALPPAEQKKEVNAAIKQRWAEKTQKVLLLPPQYDVPGKLGVSYPWSRALLVQLHVKAPEEYKRLQRLYGAEVIDAIIVDNGVKQ